jgi:hypothetical protein
MNVGRKLWSRTRVWSAKEVEGMSKGVASFPQRWAIANTLALLFGYVLYTPIAHGIGDLAVPLTRLPLAVIGFVAAFFAGSYQPWLGGPDWDILFGSVVLGSAAFLGLVPMRRRPLASTIALLGSPSERGVESAG